MVRTTLLVNGRLGQPARRTDGCEWCWTLRVEGMDGEALPVWGRGADSGGRTAGGGRRGCHGTAATAAGRGGVVPLEGDLGERPGRSPPAVAGERSGLAEAAGRARQRRARGVAASPTAKPAAARPSALSTGSGSREPRRPAGGGLGTDSASRPSSRQPARKSCPPAPRIAAMR